eukprot:gene50087-67068_t
MKDAEKIEQRLTDLEIKASFNEDLLDQLNQVIVRQQQQLDALVRESLGRRFAQVPAPTRTEFQRDRD